MLHLAMVTKIIHPRNIHNIVQFSFTCYDFSNPFFPFGAAKMSIEFSRFISDLTKFCPKQSEIATYNYKAVQFLSITGLNKIIFCVCVCAERSAVNEPAHAQCPVSVDRLHPYVDTITWCQSGSRVHDQWNLGFR